MYSYYITWVKKGWGWLPSRMVSLIIVESRRTRWYSDRTRGERESNVLSMGEKRNDGKGKSETEQDISVYVCICILHCTTLMYYFAYDILRSTLILLGLRVHNASDKRLSFSHRGHLSCNSVTYEIINIIRTTTKA